jgi:hypothetical protein
LKTVLAAALGLLVCQAAPVGKFRVHETAGMRRFGYPVRAAFPAAKSASSLRLLENGKLIPAQFTPLEDGRVEIDFNVSHAPHETKEYVVEEGASSAPAPGISIESTATSFQVRHSSGLVFDVPRNLIGLLNAVRTPRTSYLRPGSVGLVLNYKDDIEYRAGGIGHWGVPTRARILKPGPLVCAVRFESEEGLRGNRTVKSAVEMEFPRSKSWVEVRWTVEDPERLVSGMTADINLNLEGEPALVDFGAGSYVYATLRKNQMAALLSDVPRAGPPQWSIALDDQLYAAGNGPAEGWAHAMDKQKAIAVAVAGFAEISPARRDRIQVSADGRLRIQRDWTSGGVRTLNFWLHFVGMPVQVGAATSPQSMQSPLRVEWE